MSSDGGKKPSMASRLASLKRKVADRVGAASDATPEEAKRRKLEKIRERKEAAKREERAKAEEEEAKTPAERRAEALVAFIRKEVLDWQMRSVRLKFPAPLTEAPDGALYRSWVLEVQGEGDFVAREFAGAFPAALLRTLGFDLKREYAFQSLAGRVGVSFITPMHLWAEPAPKPALEGGPAADVGGELAAAAARDPPAQSVILHRYHAAAQQLGSGGVRNKIVSLAELLKKLHEATPSGVAAYFPYNVFSEIMGLRAAINAAVREAEPKTAKYFDITCPADDDFEEMLTVAEQWMEILGTHHPDDLSKTYVCHLHVGGGDVYVCGAGRDERLYLANFQHAALGDRYYDLATLSRLNGFTPSDDVVLMKTYFGVFQERQLACFRLLRAAGSLRDALHGILSRAPPAAVAANLNAFLAVVNDEEFAAYVGEHLIK
eukprot:TRINITY_DN27309_c0_g1_i1.p1 TRINITY_DN27309_c0_g1~~TRINITY_DN27309_c0_g1_i1.p1  ORF type:complete len:434 (+),score=186.37 TRINITY_DN27309_c0_g1_i1:51-1352(+)